MKNMLLDAFSDVLTLTVYLCNSGNFGNPQALHDKIDNLFKTAEAKAKRSGLNEQDVQDAKYAISAFVDESVLYSNWQFKDEWLNKPLMIEYFNDALAGEIFFQKMDRIAQESKLELLEIFYLCLMLGYEGRYRILGRDELNRYLTEMREKFNLKPIERISPHAYVERHVPKIKGAIPRWFRTLSYILVAVISIIIFAVLKLKMGSISEQVVNLIRSTV